MLNDKKIRLMSKLAAFEQKEEKDALRMMKYYKVDYLRYEILKSVVSVSLAYMIILAMIALYHLEYLVANATSLDYREYLTKIIGGYILLLIVYIFGTMLGHSIKYKQSRKKIRYYNHLLKILRSMYRKEEQ